MKQILEIKVQLICIIIVINTTFDTDYNGKKILILT